MQLISVIFIIEGDYLYCMFILRQTVVVTIRFRRQLTPQFSAAHIPGVIKKESQPFFSDMKTSKCVFDGTRVSQYKKSPFLGVDKIALLIIYTRNMWTRQVPINISKYGFRRREAAPR